MRNRSAKRWQELSNTLPRTLRSGGLLSWETGSKRGCPLSFAATLVRVNRPMSMFCGVLNGTRTLTRTVAVTLAHSEHCSRTSDRQSDGNALVRRPFLCLIVVLSMLISEGSERSRRLMHMAPEIPRAVNQDSTHFSGKRPLGHKHHLSKQLYTRWCCIGWLSWQRLSGRLREII